MELAVGDEGVLLGSRPRTSRAGSKRSRVSKGLTKCSVEGDVQFCVCRRSDAGKKSSRNPVIFQ